MPFAQRIDWKKLKATIKALEKGEKGVLGTYFKFNPDDFNGGWTWFVCGATLLYCIASHARGHLHMTKKRIPRRDSSGGLMDVPFTLDDQARLIGDRWKEFAAPEVQAVVNG